MPVKDSPNNPLKKCNPRFHVAQAPSPVRSSAQPWAAGPHFQRAANPFRARGRWLKGALHTHTTESDGALSPERLVREYRKRGFHFAALTDHDKVSRVRGPGGRFLVLCGIELGLKEPGPDKYWHFIGVGTRTLPPAKFASPLALYRLVRALAPFSILAHPYWSQLTGGDLTLFDGLSAVEVYNAGCELEIGRGYAEYQWDWCLSAGRRVTGVAVDDCHGLEQVGKAWVMVKAARASAKGILDALVQGRFYSSCGPEIRDLEISDERIEVATSPCRSISFICDRQAGAYVTADGGGEITSASYAFKGLERYVRVQCVDVAGRRAWSNPFYLEWPAKAPGD